jgi:hypothetical protein
MTCATCRRYSVATRQDGYRSAAYNCTRYKTRVSPAAKACSSFDARVKVPPAPERLL